MTQCSIFLVWFGIIVGTIIAFVLSTLAYKRVIQWLSKFKEEAIKSFNFASKLRPAFSLGVAVLIIFIAITYMPKPSEVKPCGDKKTALEQVGNKFNYAMKSIGVLPSDCGCDNKPSLAQK